MTPFRIVYVWALYPRLRDELRRPHFSSSEKERKCLPEGGRVSGIVRICTRSFFKVYDPLNLFQTHLGEIPLKKPIQALRFLIL